MTFSYFKTRIWFLFLDADVWFPNLLGLKRYFIFQCYGCWMQHVLPSRGGCNFRVLSHFCVVGGVLFCFLSCTWLVSYCLCVIWFGSLRKCSSETRVVVMQYGVVRILPVKRFSSKWPCFGDLGVWQHKSQGPTKKVSRSGKWVICGSKKVWAPHIGELWYLPFRWPKWNVPFVPKK